MGLASVDLNYVNLVDVDFDNDYPEIITHIRIMGWCNRYEQPNACKKEISNESKRNELGAGNDTNWMSLGVNCLSSM